MKGAVHGIAPMVATSQHAESVMAKIAQHRAFWAGEGPSLLFLPRRARPLYDLDGYPDRFREPERMFEFELARAREIADWPTDGIPTVRPSLGTVFVPALMGQPYEVRPGSMPWPGDPLPRQEILQRGQADAAAIQEGELMKRALAFYRLARSAPDVYAYHADTQGVFDIAHLLYGTDIFLDMLTDGEVTEVFELVLGWYLETTRQLKDAIGEPAAEMVHGHGTEQGLYFPNAGTRLSEDTATLLSPKMIEQDLLPFMERSAAPFGGAFVHFCGKHDAFFRLLCEQPWCVAIDLGNPEKYDLAELLGICAQTETVFYSRVAPLEGEGWRDYGRRLGAAVRESGCRCVLRATVFPESRDDAAAMLETFHEQTCAV